MRSGFIVSFLLLVATVGFTSSPVWAAAGTWAGDAEAKARLITTSDAVGDTAVIDVGLQIQMGEGWHTYWRSPGMAGLPPQLDWSESRNDTGNVKDVTLLYPAPRRYTDFGMETIGYRQSVIFPLDVTLLHPGQATVLKVMANLLVCNQTCVPKIFNLSLSLPAGGAGEAAEAALLKNARAAVPTRAGSTRSGETLRIEKLERQGDRLSFHVTAEQGLSTPDIFVENEKDISFSAPEIIWKEGHRHAVLTVKPTDKLPEGITLDKMPVVATLVDGDHAVEFHDDGSGVAAAAATADQVPPSGAAPPAPATTPVASDAPSIGMQYALLLALVGGFILNLMPCVLPVLSLKVLALIRHGGGKATHVRRSFIVTACGIITSFLALALVTIFLKEAGQAVGWGVQFQQPVFLVTLILILGLFAASLWDWFSITLPYKLVDRLGFAEDHPQLLGDFLTGAFATLLATPCTAPFLGTAVGFALSSGVVEIALIFLALGIGMALPYLIIALVPRMAVCLPRPGAWMQTLKHVLGIALALTALWLLWVLSAQLSFPTVVAIAIAAFLFVICLVPRRIKTLWRAGVMTCLAIFCLTLAIIENTPVTQTVAVDHGWRSFDEASIPAEVTEGHTVFVDVTASWCLTCKANKKFVLSRPEVAARLFGHPDVVAMQADWTSPNPTIAAYLQKFGRYGIPFNVVYSPRHPQGLPLPELLTIDAVLAVLP